MKRLQKSIRNYFAPGRNAQATQPSIFNPHGASKIINDFYLTTKPDPQNALDIFRGEWSSKFPPPFADLKAGGALLFQDARFQWFLDEIGGVTGKTTLELGPLEGGHSYMLEQSGVERVISVEANTRAYLKCLITKEILKLKRVDFLMGDFLTYLRDPSCPQFDVVIASGVLYHMSNPVELISLLSEHCRESLFIWTHYYDKAYVERNHLEGKFPQTEISNYKGFNHHLYLQLYQQALNLDGFCGGSEPYSYWLTREELLACLKHFGFTDIQINFEQPDHPHGPSFALLAKRSA